MAGSGGLSATAAAQLQNSAGMIVATAAGYLAFILALNIVLRVYLLRDVWARVAASTTAQNLEAVTNVAAKGDLADALGEGFTGNLDVVGF
jgi:adhesin HecA-like repeat protein